jgi:MFS family permease
MMRDDFDLGKRAGFGTVTIAGSMLVGRLVGDHVLDRVGERRLLLGAVGTIGAGVAMTALAPVAAVAFAGLLIWGLGLSVVFPQLYASAARLPGTSAGTGLGSMLFGQRFGTMATAAGVGALAEWRSVRFAFFVVGLLAMVVLLFTIRGMHRLADSPR